MQITMDRAYNHFLFLATLVLLHFLITTCSNTPSSTSNPANNNNINHDLEALLAFKASLSDPNSILPMNWSTSTSVCNWIGITCNIRHGRVATINLPSHGLSGTIPPRLGNLSFLVRLNVANNSFHGNLPRELANLRRLKTIIMDWNQFDGVFPSWLGGLTQLQYLSLRNNRFSGSLSSTLFNATKLETIRLGYNNLTGNLPQEFKILPKLQVFDVGFNQLRGPVPRALLNLSSLQIFSLNGNSLSGYLPERICHHLPQLQGLYLSINEFQGKIPSDISECSRLEVLSLAQNKLSGNILRELCNLTTLRAITIGTNDLQGTIPQEIGNLYKLEFINLDSSRLEGLIPFQLFNISTLQTISLVDNDLSGELPQTLGVFLPNLEILYLDLNKLSGFVLTSISNSSNLKLLDVSGNQFTGAIPHSLGNLRFLEGLTLSDNNFSGDSSLSGELSFLNSLTKCRNLKILWMSVNPLNGSLPISIGNLSTSLESFSASDTGIKGEIPSSIANLSNLASLGLQSNHLTGMIPTTLKWLLKLQRIDLRENEIEGPIPNVFCQMLNLGMVNLAQNLLSETVPACIGNITSLRNLYLYSNNLTSNLPVSFWSLKDILKIDLSDNSLIGFLPSQIENFKSLILLDLSRNHFSGELPSTIGALQSLQELSLEHNNLQGLLPESMKDLISLQYLDLSFNNLTGVIPKSLETLSDLQYLNVSYNKLRGPIPRGGPFVNFTNLSFLSNEALCGVPWLQPCPTFEHKSKKTKVVLFVFLGVGSSMLALVISLLLVRMFRRKIVAPGGDLFITATYERVSFHEIQQITNGFNESNLLGSGTFGSVYKGTHADGMIWAIKVFHLQLQDEFKSFERECEILRCLRHRNLTKVISVCSNPDFKALVLEYMPNGSLENWLYLEDKLELDFMQRLDIMIDVACGLEYLHYGYSVPVIHCDLKPSNILLDQGMVGHLSDFGIAKLLEDGESMVQTNTLATFGYIAPEYGLEGLVSRHCDVYSFGITLMETFTKRKPKDEMFTEELSIRHWVQQSIPDSVLHVIDAKLLELIDELASMRITYCGSSILQIALNCTTNAPKERPNIKDVLAALQKIKINFHK